MGSRVVGVLAFITFVHLGARSAAPATLVQVSDLPTPTGLPESLAPVVTSGCSLLIVYDPTCPACARAAQLQSEVDELALDIVWLAGDDAARDHYETRVHAAARIAVVPEAHDALMVRAVPAAFLVAEGTVVYASTITGSEDLDRVARRCTPPVEG